jgi:hypothetical protein
LVVARAQPGLAGYLRLVRRMGIPIFRAAHMGIDHGAIDIGVEAASVGGLFHCSIFQNLFVLVSISSSFGAGLFPSPVA